MLSGSCMKKIKTVGWVILAFFWERELCDLTELEVDGMLETVKGLN